MAGSDYWPGPKSWERLSALENLDLTSPVGWDVQSGEGGVGEGAFQMRRMSP